MKKIIKKQILYVVTCLMFLCTIPLSVSAVSNPYPSSQTISGVTTIPCTYYAWQQAYDNTGVAMPNFGNAVNWYSRAESSGYSVGTVAKPKSIAVWSGGTYGHVSYVVSVNGSKMTVNEGGMNSSNGTAYNGNGIYNGNVVNSIVGQQKGNGSSKVLIGFIYLTETSTSSVSVTVTPDKNDITNTNAILWARVDKPSNYAVTKIGIKVRKDGSTYESGWSNAWSKNEAPSKNYVNDTYMLPYYNLKDELGLTLTHATKYYYKFYAVVNGTEYWSSEYSFTTTGSHSYGSWSTTKAATCTESGTQTRKCTGCSKTETKTLSATGHSYGSWTTTKSATCTAKGTQTRKCSKCTSTETKTLSALGHSYSTSWTTDKAATCTSAGSKSHHCSRCNVKKDITTISPLSHSWGEWTVSVEATTTSAGKKIRKCTRSGCTATETSTIAVLSTDGHTHNFTEWTIDTPNTCTTDGVSIRKCTVCDQAETKSITATGHKFSDWAVTKEATVETDGLLERSCSECGEKENDIIPKIISEDNSVYVNNSSEETQLTPQEIENDNSNPIVIAIFIIFAIILVIGIAIAIIIKIKKLH